MGIVSSTFLSEESAAEPHVNALLETLKSSIVGDPMEFSRTRQLRADIQALSPGERMELFYSWVALYTDAISALSVCASQSMKSEAGGCLSSACCRMAPGVYLLERNRLDTLPRSGDRLPDYCGFFHGRKRTCTVYANRPLACRIFSNFTNDDANCTKASLAVNDAKAISIFAEPFLGEYTGPYGA